MEKQDVSTRFEPTVRYSSRTPRMEQTVTGRGRHVWPTSSRRRRSAVSIWNALCVTNIELYGTQVIPRVRELMA